MYTRHGEIKVIARNSLYFVKGLLYFFLAQTCDIIQLGQNSPCLRISFGLRYFLPATGILGTIILPKYPSPHEGHIHGWVTVVIQIYII